MVTIKGRFEAIIGGTNQSSYRRIKSLKCLRKNMNIKSKKIQKCNDVILKKWAQKYINRQKLRESCMTIIQHILKMVIDHVMLKFFLEPVK